MNEIFLNSKCSVMESADQMDCQITCCRYAIATTLGKCYKNFSNLGILVNIANIGILLILGSLGLGILLTSG